eukprot:TRINITY_DN7178_c0_g1_i5.p1 TRINITY_DN7178_c0_g1~~TRINITY_DN7178_c0_g1_i5.p1  ORF type:complete len:759 (+),score=144.84 TRINITY_DN7178_c0_g1_i5:1679-3955(+)
MSSATRDARSPSPAGYALADDVPDDFRDGRLTRQLDQLGVEERHFRRVIADSPVSVEAAIADMGNAIALITSRQEHIGSLAEERPQISVTVAPSEYVSEERKQNEALRGKLREMAESELLLRDLLNRSIESIHIVQTKLKEKEDMWRKLLEKKDEQLVLILKREELHVGKLRKRIVTLREQHEEKAAMLEAVQEQFRSTDKQHRNLNALMDIERSQEKLRSEWQESAQDFKAHMATMANAFGGLSSIITETASIKSDQDLRARQLYLEKRLTLTTAKLQEQTLRVEGLEKERDAMRLQIIIKDEDFSHFQEKTQQRSLEWRRQLGEIVEYNRRLFVVARQSVHSMLADTNERIHTYVRDAVTTFTNGFVSRTNAHMLFIYEQLKQYTADLRLFAISSIPLVGLSIELPDHIESIDDPSTERDTSRLLAVLGDVVAEIGRLGDAIHHDHLTRGSKQRAEEEKFKRCFANLQEEEARRAAMEEELMARHSEYEQLQIQLRHVQVLYEKERTGMLNAVLEKETLERELEELREQVPRPGPVGQSHTATAMLASAWSASAPSSPTDDPTRKERLATLTEFASLLDDALAPLEADPTDQEHVTKLKEEISEFFRRWSKTDGSLILPENGAGPSSPPGRSSQRSLDVAGSPPLPRRISMGLGASAAVLDVKMNGTPPATSHGFFGGTCPNCGAILGERARSAPMSESEKVESALATARNDLMSRVVQLYQSKLFSEQHLVRPSGPWITSEYVPGLEGYGRLLSF